MGRPRVGSDAVTVVPAVHSAPSSPVRFTIDGRTVETAVPGGARLLDVLRRDLGLTGTKEGCGEGECGACSVLLDGAVVASCLVPMSQVDGSAILTVEALAQDGGLDPLQRAFADAGAVQCGFCTPGLLMAARAWLDRGAPPTEGAVREAIAGNLCRCTGYGKVVEAIVRAAETWPDSGAGAPARASGIETTIASATSRRGAAGQAGHPGRPEVIVPRTLAEALQLLADRPGLRPIAGGTDVMVELAAGAADAPTLVDLWRLDELRGIHVEAGELVVGPLTTYSELRASAQVAAVAPVLTEAAAEVGAVQIQNRGTIGGNIVTASPAGDMLPILLATDADLEVASRRGPRRIPAASFWTAYRTTALRPGELLVAIRIPLVPARRTRFRKLGTRRAQAISKVVLGVSWQTGDGGPRGAWRDVRVALGSVAPTPMRATRTEAVLEGAVPSRALADEVADTVRTEIAPIDDVRSTAEYRRLVTGRILRRIVLDEAGAG